MPHPDFAANPDHQWFGGQLHALLPALTLELEAKEPGARVWRVLSGGAFVSLATDGGRRVLRIWRSQHPGTESGVGKFAQECDTFIRYLGIDHWKREVDPEAKGIGIMLNEQRKTA